MICYRCQTYKKPSRMIQVKNGIATTTYCKHCYTAEFK